MGADAEGNPDARDREAEHCPRCGYDLGGVIDAWREHCPIDGVCTECGLRFRWAELLNPALRNLPWLYEHPSPRADGRNFTTSSARNFIATLARSLIPWIFWREVRPHHKVAPKRLVLFHLTLFVSASTLYWIVFAGAWLALEVSASAGGSNPGSVGPSRMLEIVVSAAFSLFGVEWSQWTVFWRNSLGESPVFIYLLFVYFTAFCALIAMCVPSFWMSARTLPRHIFRIGAYSMTLPTLAFIIYSAAVAWEWTGNRYGRWGNPAWWQREAWLTDNQFYYTVMPSLLFVFLWMTLFWWFGFRRGLGMRWRDATILTSLCAFTGVLGTIVCAFYSAPL